MWANLKTIIDRNIKPFGEQSIKWFHSVQTKQEVDKNFNKENMLKFVWWFYYVFCI